MTSLLAVLAAEEAHDPAVSIHWLWPEQAELIYGSIASIIIFAALFKFAGPMVKKSFAARTEGIQSELDGAAADQAAASAEASEIRQAAGDIDAERQRRFAEADAAAEAVLTDGRARLEQEVVDIRARAEADIASASGRAGDELHAEISRLAGTATDRLLAGGVIDDAAQQELIESYIARVGASS